MSIGSIQTIIIPADTTITHGACTCGQCGPCSVYPLRVPLKVRAGAEVRVIIEPPYARVIVIEPPRLKMKDRQGIWVRRNRP